jgi:uncharacterized membrane protein
MSGVEYETSVTIAAPPELVWQLTLDVESWPAHTPTMTSVRRLDSGPLRVGSEAEIKQPGRRPARWRVTELVPGRVFAWATTALGVTCVGEHLVEQDAAGCRLVLRIRLSGRLAGPAGAVSARRMRTYLRLEAEGFRRAAQALHER